MNADAAHAAFVHASELLDAGAYAEVGRVLTTLREHPATAAKATQLDLAEELLVECVRLEAQSEEHRIAAEQARRRCQVLRAQVVSILQLSVGGAHPDIDAQVDPADATTRGGPGQLTVVPAPSSHVRLDVHFFGEFEVFVEDRPVRNWHGLKSRAVLQLLVLNAPRSVGVDAIIDALWPETNYESGRRSLHQAMYMLRKSLRDRAPEADDPVTFERPDYRLSTKVDVWSDVAEFERSVAAGRQAASRRLVDGLHDLETAVDLYRGEFLEGALYEDWTYQYRDRLRRGFNEAATTLFDVYGHLRRLNSLIDLAHKVVEFDSCNEAAHRQLIEAYDAQGKRHLAIQQFRTCERELARILGVEPAPETQRLMRRLLAQN